MTIANLKDFGEVVCRFTIAMTVFALSMLVAQADDLSKSGNEANVLSKPGSTEELSEFTEHSRYTKAALPVGMLSIKFRGSLGARGCTAFIIAPGTILTAAHCFEHQGRQLENILLHMDYLHRLDKAEPYPVLLNMLEFEPGLDYALLEVDVKTNGDPHDIYGQVTLSLDLPEDEEELFVVHHPWGDAKEITRRYCRIRGKVKETLFKVGHACHTENGSSGAPVFEENEFLSPRVVAMHKNYNERLHLNEAIPIALLVEKSCFLRALYGLNTCNDESITGIRDENVLD